MYALLVSTATGTGDSRVLAVLIGAGAFGGAVVSSAGVLAHDIVGVAGVLVLAAAAMALTLVAVPAPSSRLSVRVGRRVVG